MKLIPDPPYSLVLAPCEFYVSRYVKAPLAGLSFEDIAELFGAVRVLLEHIKK
jgi:hypothetical protein